MWEIKIAICEDERAQRKELRTGIDSWLANLSEDSQGSPPAAYEIFEYASAAAFYSHQKKDGPFDLLFLDIDLGAEGEAALDGLAIADEVRKNDPTVVIVFVTSYFEYVLQGYKVHAFDYLLKPLKQSELERVLSYAREHSQDAIGSFFLFETNTESKHISLNDIIYLHAQRQWVELHSTNGVDVFRARISDVVQELKSFNTQMFVQPHRSYLVNLLHARSVSKTEICLNNDIRVPVGRPRQQEVFKAWLNWHGKGNSGK